MLPIIRLRRNLTYYVKINVADNDFDRYTCIWSNSTQECGGVCRSLLNLPNSTCLNETSCILRFTPVTVGFYAMALTILDFENPTSTTPLSRVPIQFIFNVWTSNATCSLPPPPTTTKTTALLTTTTRLLTTVRDINTSSSFPVGGIMGIVIGSLLIVMITGAIISHFLRHTQTDSSAKSNPIPTKKKSISETIQ
jgi:hypothetical protein